MGNGGTAINVDVYSENESEFRDPSEELRSLGYTLRFCNNLASFATLKNHPDICIVDVSKLSECHGELKSLSSPYLLSGADFLKENVVPSESFENSVGFINAEPSVSDICVNIQLGLLWHKEREHFSRRGQDIDEKISNNRITGIAVGMLMQKSGLAEGDVLNSLKSASRSKQRRMVDVSREIIDDIDKTNEALSSLGDLKKWLAATISYRDR